MKSRGLLIALLPMLAVLALAADAFAGAYNAQPKLVVILVIDQFRGDFLERARDQLGDSGFRLLTDRAAYFPDCFYNYANTETGPGHATLLTGTYTDGHGIGSNNWWNQDKKRMVSSVFDDSTRQVGIANAGPGASPHNLLSDTLGDELKLATQGQSRVFTISLKDRSAVLPGGYSADAAFWIAQSSGAWITSTYYMAQLPAWLVEFNRTNTDKYWNRDWKDTNGNVLRSTARPAELAKDSFYETVGATPFANDYEFELARALIAAEKLGEGKTTDLLVISLSASDILGHKVGPDAPEARAMVLAEDRQIADFFQFLGSRFGLANVWIAFTADHGVSPAPAYAKKFRLPARTFSGAEARKQLNAEVAKAAGHPGPYILDQDGAYLYLSSEAFTAAKIKESDAERLVGDLIKQMGWARTYITRTELASGELPAEFAATRPQWQHSYSSNGGWYVLTIPAPFTFPWSSPTGTTHGSPYFYDTHVPLALYGLPFQSGVYRGRCEIVDMTATLASMLGIRAPARAVGRVLVETLRHQGPAQ
ncbi:MAG: alkaline phosphatase family protein [Terriglobales bacterium]